MVKQYKQGKNFCYNLQEPSIDNLIGLIVKKILMS